MKNTGRGRLWVFGRHLQRHWGESAIIFVVLLSGFLFYAFYGSWSEATVSTADVDIAPLRIPSDIILEVDHWALGVEAPDLSPSQYITESYLHQGFKEHELWTRLPTAYRPTVLPPLVESSVEGISLPVMSQGGTVIMWGLPNVPEQLEASLQLIDGRWPENHSEIAVHVGFASRTGLIQGEETELVGQRVLSGEGLRLSVEVVGSFQGDYDVFPEIITTVSTATRLTGTDSGNLLLLWSEEVEPVEVHSPVTGETTSYELPQLPDLLLGMRWGTRAPTVGSFIEADLFSSAVAAGRILPYGIMVEGRARVDGSEEMGLRGMYTRLGGRLASVTMMIFLLQAVALTVILSIVVVDQQRAFGTYKVLGVSPGQVSLVYFLQVVLTGVLAGVSGIIIFRLLAPAFGDVVGFELRMPGRSMVLWYIAILAMSLWCGHLARSLFETTEIDSLLRENYEFDWWSLVRMKGVRPELYSR